MNRCTLWRVKINKNKTIALYFSISFSFPYHIAINNVTIPWNNGANYMCVIFDKLGKQEKHIPAEKLKVTGEP